MNTTKDYESRLQALKEEIDAMDRLPVQQK